MVMDLLDRKPNIGPGSLSRRFGAQIGVSSGLVYSFKQAFVTLFPQLAG